MFAEEQAIVKFLSKSNVNRLEIFSGHDFGF
jgi:hypothetical protein